MKSKCPAGRKEVQYEERITGINDAVVVLGYLSEIAKDILVDEILAHKSNKLKEEIYKGIETFGKVKKDEFGEVYAYEVDGFGEYNIMDDANPYYYEGKAAKGIGSPHTPVRYIWHISLAIQGLTADTKDEKMAILKVLEETDGGKALMHEGFCVDDPCKYTREWFSWANAMFSELVLDYCVYQVKL